MADVRSRKPVLDRTEESAEAASALAPEVGALVDLDPVLFGRALARAAAGAARRPAAAAEAGIDCAVALARATLSTALRGLGQSAPGPLSPDGADRRFADPAWEDNPAFFWRRQSYLIFRRLAEDLVAAGDLDEPTRAKAAFAVSLLADALAPTNLLLSNPPALKRAFETGGAERAGRDSQLPRRPSPQRGAARVRSMRVHFGSARTWRRRRARSCFAMN
jgi:polyhydroxyalkanoate synthase